MNSALKWKLAFALLLVFVAGGATGVFLGVHPLRHHVMFGPPHSGDMPDRKREHLRHARDLTDEQDKKTAPTMVATSASLESMSVETEERVRSSLAESKKEVVPLTSD